MPREYEAMRDALIRKGMSEKDAKTEAAKTWNRRHPENPNPWLRESGKDKMATKARLKRIFR